jgi:nitrogen fixation protein FixH
MEQVCGWHMLGGLVGRLVVVIDVNPSHGFWTTRLMKLFGHEGK